VKADQQRFPRARLTSGKPVEVLSTLGEASLASDTRAYTAFMHHLKEVDTGAAHGAHDSVAERSGPHWRYARPFHPGRSCIRQAGAAGADGLSAEEQADAVAGSPQAVEAAGGKTAGTWQEVFGKTPSTDEIFMAWNYARYMDHMAKAGKAEYPVPVFTQHVAGAAPGPRCRANYPSGCPEPLVIDIWKAGAPFHRYQRARTFHLRNLTTGRRVSTAPIIRSSCRNRMATWAPRPNAFLRHRGTPDRLLAVRRQHSGTLATSCGHTTRRCRRPSEGHTAGQAYAVWAHELRR